MINSDKDKRLQILQIIEVLKKHSSEENPLSRKQIIDYLQKYYDNAPSKKDTIKSYMDSLTRYYNQESNREYIIYNTLKNEFGEDIFEDDDDDDFKEYSNDSPSGSKKNNVPFNNQVTKYFLKKNELDLDMLMTIYYEIIQSKSLDEDTINEIARKLESMMDDSELKMLSKMLEDDGTQRIARPESASNILKIKDAIKENKAISFDYYAYNLSGNLIRKTSEFLYHAIPLKFVQSAGKNYLIAYHIHYKQERTYRVDKMRNIKSIDLPQDLSIELSSRTRNRTLVFMHNDVILNKVVLRCEMRILDNVIEQFKDSYMIKPKEEGYFEAHLRNVSNLGIRYWILQYSSACEVLSPVSLRADVKDTLEKALSWYNKE